jgi:hypothetical protein
MSEKKHIQPIKPELRGLLEEFLAFSEYQMLFLQFGRALGYEGDDVEHVKKTLLFGPNSDGELMFSLAGLYDLFLEFQLLQNLKDVEPYKTLLAVKPASIRALRELSKRIMSGEEISNEDVKKLFNDTSS